MVSTLEVLVRLPGGARVVFDHGNQPLASGAEAYARTQGELAARVSAVGETFHSRFDTPGLHARMAGQGWRILRDLGPEALRERFAPGQGAGPSPGSYVLSVGTR